jgi:mannosylglycerate hydrolase
VDNPARDHKLRVLFPTDLQTQTWFSDSPFDLTERPIAVQQTPGWDEPAQEIWWQQSLCTVRAGQDGLAVIAPECKESACIDDPRRTLALSLFRAFGQTVGTAGEDGPQQLGRSVFRYQVVPYQGDPASAGLLGRSARMRAGLRAVVLPPHPGDLPASQGLVSLSPDWLVITALKKQEAGAGVVVRFFNPSPDPVQAVLRFAPELSAAWRANLREQLGESLPISEGNTVRLQVRGKEIVSLALRPA